MQCVYYIFGHTETTNIRCSQMCFPGVKTVYLTMTTTSTSGNYTTTYARSLEYNNGVFTSQTPYYQRSNAARAVSNLSAQPLEIWGFTLPE